MPEPDWTPPGEITVNVWLAGLASLLIVTVPAATFPFASVTVRTQEVPLGTICPQFPHCLAMAPPNWIPLMWRSADPALRRIRAGATRLMLICGAVAGAIFAKKLL